MEDGKHRARPDPPRQDVVSRTSKEPRPPSCPPSARYPETPTGRFREMGATHRSSSSPLPPPPPRHPLCCARLRGLVWRQDEAHLVFSTLNSSGLPCMDQTASFEVLVVDEAAQSVEVSTIIPLR